MALNDTLISLHKTDLFYGNKFSPVRLGHAFNNSW